jgi:hypothetical protein
MHAAACRTAEPALVNAGPDRRAACIRLDASDTTEDQG